MSQDNDKIKGNTAGDVQVLNPANDVLTNEVNKEEKKAVSNDQNTLNNGVNNETQKLVPIQPIPNSTSYPFIRENMVSKATEFLTAAAVKSTPIERKIKFLHDKGLTNQEIQESINRAATFYQNYSVPTPPNDHYNLSNTSGAVQTPYESQSWFRQLFWPLTVAATVAYIGYQIYKKYIENWLFIKRKSPLEHRIEEIESSLKRCLSLLEMSQLSSESLNQPKDLDMVRSELKSIKSLLLNRSQFPPAPVSLSIPSWQLSKNLKLRAKLHNKVNDTDTQNVSHQSIFNGSDDSNVASTSTVNDDSTPNNQNSVKSNDQDDTDQDIKQ